MRKITPFLWFDEKAEEAAKYYVSIFGNSRILHVARYGEAGSEASGRPKGSVMTVAFELDGEEFVALNGGPGFTFSPAVSFVVNVKTQEELDALWEKLSDGGVTQECGWLTDKYGVTWQVVPDVLGEWMSDPDPARSERVMKALIRMKKLDIEGLKTAYEQEPGDVRAQRKAG